MTKGEMIKKIPNMGTFDYGRPSEFDEMMRKWGGNSDMYVWSYANGQTFGQPLNITEAYHPVAQKEILRLKKRVNKLIKQLKKEEEKRDIIRF